MPKYQQPRQSHRAEPYQSRVDTNGLTEDYLRANNPHLRFSEPTNVSRAYGVLNHARTARSAKKIWDYAKLVAPSQTIKEATRLVAMPAARFIGRQTGFTQIETATFYTMEAVAVYTDPVGYAADRTIQYFASKGANKGLDYFEITNPEIRDAVTIGTTEITSALIDKAKDSDTGKKLRDSVKGRLDESWVGKTAQKVDGMSTSVINSALSAVHMDPNIPLREQIKFNKKKSKDIVLELFDYDDSWVEDDEERMYEVLKEAVPEISGEEAADIIEILKMVENTGERQSLKFISHSEEEKDFELCFSNIPDMQGGGHVEFESPDQIKINGSDNPLKDGHIINKSGNSPYMSLVFTLYSHCRSLEKTDDSDKKALLSQLIRKEYAAAKIVRKWSQERSNVRDNDSDWEREKIRIASRKLAVEVMGELFNLKNNDTCLFHSSYPGHTMYYVFANVNGKLQMKIYNGGRGAGRHLNNYGEAHPVVFSNIDLNGDSMLRYLESNFGVQLSRKLVKLDGESPEDFKQRTDSKKQEWLHTLYDEGCHYLGNSYVDENDNSFPLQKDKVGNCTKHNLDAAGFGGVLHLGMDCDVRDEFTAEALDDAYELRLKSQGLDSCNYGYQYNEPEYKAKTTRSGKFFGEADSVPESAAVSEPQQTVAIFT